MIIIIIEMQVLQLALQVEVVAKIEMIDLIIGRTEEAPIIIIIIIDDVIEIVVEDHPTVVPDHENVRRDERGIEEVVDVLDHMIVVIIIDHVLGRIMDVLRREREDGEEKEEEKEEIVGKGNDHRTILLRIIGGIVVGRMIDMKEKEEMAPPGEEGIIVMIVRRRGEGGAVVEIAAVVAEDDRVVMIDTDLAVGIGMAGVVNDRGRAPLIVITVVVIITIVVMICIVWVVAEVVTHSTNSLEEGITTIIIKMVGPLEGIIIMVVAVRKRNVVVGTGIRIVIITITITITTVVVTIIITIKEAAADHPIKEAADRPINLQRKKVVGRRRLQNRKFDESGAVGRHDTLSIDIRKDVEGNRKLITYTLKV